MLLLEILEEDRNSLKAKATNCVTESIPEDVNEEVTKVNDKKYFLIKILFSGLSDTLLGFSVEMSMEIR